MHLIDALASGIIGASNGTAVITSLGTATPATYYLDFAGTQAIAGSSAGVALDANGGATVYVNQLVNVSVRDANGVTIRAFVAGAEAPGVEVISRSFTGTSYTDGSSGTSKPTTLQAVLDAWLTSAGAPDFNVSVNGSPVLITAAVAGLTGLFFNVKSYGAVGDGVADDGSAIQAANAAALLVGGGILFFPPGTYRSTTTITLGVGVSAMGCGATASKLRVDNGALSSLLNLTGTDTGVREVSGIGFGALSNFTGSLVQLVSGGPRVSFTDCAFGGDTFSKGNAIFVNSSVNVASSTVSCLRCQMYVIANTSALVNQGAGRTVIDNCDFVVSATGAYNASVIFVASGLFLRDSNFTMPGPSSGTAQYITLSQTGALANQYPASVIIGNTFATNLSVALTCIYNSSSTPSYDVYEVGNSFGLVGGLPFAAITAYGYAVDGYSGAATDGRGFPAFHGSRMGLMESFTRTNGGVAALNPKALGLSRITYSGAAGSISVTSNKGSVGEEWSLEICNNSGGNCVVSVDANIILDAASPSFTVATLTRQVLHFRCVPNLASSGVQWAQISKAAVT